MVVRRVFRSLVKAMIEEFIVNLELFEQIGAAKSSASYLTEKMGKAMRCSSPTELMRYALESVRVNGAVLEFGVFRGGSIRIISEKFPGKSVYGFDSFEGLPEEWRPGFPEKTFDMRGVMPNVPANVVLVKGWFDQTLPIWNRQNSDIVSILHIDCDLYSSTKTIFQELSDKIVDGTVIVFDEYFNYPGWENGEFKAFQEWIRSSSRTYRYLAVNVKHEQVAVEICGKLEPSAWN